MFWVIIVVVIALIAVSLDSVPGKVVVGAAVLAIGLLLLRWITGITFFVTLAKACAVLMVVTIVGAILIAIMN